MKRIASIIVMVCMTLHCAGRLGVLSWIYEQRHVIAFELGLSDERPIAECGIAFLDDGLVVIGDDGEDEAVFQPGSIDLFFAFNQIDLDVAFTYAQQQYPVFIQEAPSQPGKGIFHPPLVA